MIFFPPLSCLFGYNRVFQGPGRLKYSGINALFRKGTPAPGFELPIFGFPGQRVMVTQWTARPATPPIIIYD